MPIDRHRLRGNKRDAKEFLLSQAGILLHELGHYVAANESGLAAGHIAIEASDCKTTSGRFVISSEYLTTLGVDQCAFISAAGAMAELYFCDLTSPARLLPDIAAFCSLLTWKDPRLTTASLIGLWHDQYSARFVKLMGAVETNFDTCRRLCERGDFLLDGVHVIPTYTLDPPNLRSRTERDIEIVQTAPLSVREAVRREFLNTTRPI